MNREDFPMLKHDIVYFDSGATSLKPLSVIGSVDDYYSNYSANAHRGDYTISLKVDAIYESVRGKVRDFIGASSSDEIVFTSGTTDSINRIVFGFMKNYLKKGDEVLITMSEHASNVLPWYELEKLLGIVVKFIPLDSDNKINLSILNETITDKTRVISIAHITNVIGDVRPIKEISEIAHNKNILLVVDGAQSVPHIKTNVVDMGIDFLAFSSHKMLGPTGTGVLYARKDLLEKMEPLNYGGGMNVSFDSDKEVIYKDIPFKFEAGTPNIDGVIGLGAAISYLVDIGMDNIHQYEVKLRKYLIDKLTMLDNITIYNKDSESGIVIFNIEGIFSEDTSRYLNQYNICVRAGTHCSKMVKNIVPVKNTCRISLYLYNDYSDIDKLIEVLSNSKDIFKVIL